MKNELKKDINLNLKNSGSTIVHSAYSYIHFEIIKLLIKDPRIDLNIKK